MRNDLFNMTPDIKMILQSYYHENISQSIKLNKLPFPQAANPPSLRATGGVPLIHGLLILAELLNWYVFYIPNWVFGAQMKVRTFALVIDWKKIDSSSRVQTRDSWISPRNEGFLPNCSLLMCRLENSSVIKSLVYSMSTFHVEM